MGHMDTDEVLQLMIDVAEQAIRPRFRALASEEIDEKKPGDFVTIADKQAEQLITAQLRARIPGVLVVGEEAAFENPESSGQLADAEIAYVIDPVDGTGNFVKGSPKYAVMVTEVRSGHVTRSWIWQPELDKAYVAEIGAGAYCNGQRLSREPVRGRAHGGATHAGAKRFDLAGTVDLTINPNKSAGFDYPDMLEGRLDFMIYRRPMPWDHLPGLLLLSETGGVTIDVSGEPYGPAHPAGTSVIVAAVNESLARQVAGHWRGPDES